MPIGSSSSVFVFHAHQTVSQAYTLSMQDFVVDFKHVTSVLSMNSAPPPSNSRNPLRFSNRNHLELLSANLIIYLYYAVQLQFTSLISRPLTTWHRLCLNLVERDIEQQLQPNKNMKKTLSIIAGIAAVMAVTTAQASPMITGTVNFGGNVTLADGSGTTVSTVGSATEVKAWSGTYVSSSSGNLSAPFLTGVTFTAPWVFGAGKANLWSYTTGGDTFTFSLITSTAAVLSGSPLTLSSTGSGTIWDSLGNYAATPGTWAFSTQDPSGTDTSGNPVFSFSAASGTVPDGGATVMLLGVALSAVGLLRKKLVA